MRPRTEEGRGGESGGNRGDWGLYRIEEGLAEGTTGFCWKEGAGFARVGAFVKKAKGTPPPCRH